MLLPQEGYYITLLPLMMSSVLIVTLQVGLLSHGGEGKANQTAPCTHRFSSQNKTNYLSSLQEQNLTETYQITSRKPPSSVVEFGKNWQVRNPNFLFLLLFLQCSDSSFGIANFRHDYYQLRYYTYSDWQGVDSASFCYTSAKCSIEQAWSSMHGFIPLSRQSRTIKR